MSYTEEFLKEHEQPIWLEYRKGVEYNRTKNLYDDTEKNYNFYHGKQWENAQLGDIQPTVQNIIKPIVKYKLGVIYQNHYEISYNPQAYATIEEGKNLTEICKQLDRYTAKIWENEKVDQKVREATKDACINDEGIIHSYYDVENDRVIAEVFKEYGTERWVIEESLCFLLQTYWEEHGKKAIEQAKNGYITHAMPYNPVSFVKQFMKDETYCEVEFAEKSKISNIENNIIGDADFTELTVGEYICK
jgi:hypothetical protein